MTTPKPGRILKAMQKGAHGGHGPVYRWLRVNHQEIQDGFAQTDASWDTLVARMVGDGVTGRHGAIPNRRSTAKVWVRGREQVAQRDQEQRCCTLRRPGLPGTQAVQQRQRVVAQRRQRDAERVAGLLGRPACDMDGLGGGREPVRTLVQDQVVALPSWQPVACRDGRPQAFGERLELVAQVWP